MFTRQCPIQLHLTVSKVQDPFFNITVRAVVPASADIFRLIRLDDQAGVEKLFSNRGARPNDLQLGDERSALYVCSCVLCRPLELCNP